MGDLLESELHELPWQYSIAGKIRQQYTLKEVPFGRASNLSVGVKLKEEMVADRLIRLLAEVARQTGSIDPFDASVVANFNVFDELSASYNNASTLMATDQW